MDNQPDVSLLYAVASVSLRRAGEVLGVQPRQIRTLVKSGKLEQLGAGHFKRVTSKSILRRMGMDATMRHLQTR